MPKISAKEETLCIFNVMTVVACCLISECLPFTDALRFVGGHLVLVPRVR